MNVSDLTRIRTFRPSGPVSGAFIGDSASTVKALLGPVGGGKSVANVYDSVRRPSLMPACNDGRIRYRRAIVGSTYGQIERNLYPTWKRWIPEDGGDITPVSEWKGGGGRSAVHKLEWDVLRGNQLITVMAEYIFAAVGDESVEDFVRGFEPTDFWLYELDLLPPTLLGACVTRLGRYPATGDDPDAISKKIEYRTQVAADLNAPDTDSWFYSMFEENPSPGMRVYKQPSGKSPKAENIEHLPAGYYDTQISVLSKMPGGKHLVTRMVHAQYAPSRAGDPVYEEYSDDLHLAPDELKPARGVPIVLGFDQGLGQPACVGFQCMPNGQRRILLEVIPGRMSARRFAAEVRLELEAVAPGHILADVHFADPAGFTGADTEDGELSWAEIVAAELGIVIMPAETQDIGLRTTAVVDYLTYMISPGEPGLMLSRRCRHTRKGFVSHYMFDKRPAEKAQSRKPIKNFWANIHDALQYGFLGVAGRFGAIQGVRATHGNGHNSRVADTGCTIIQAPVMV